MPETPEAEAPSPEERYTRRREYTGAGSTLGVAALIVLAVGLAIWWFEIRGSDDTGNVSTKGLGVVALPDGLNPTDKAPAAQEGRAAPDFKLATPDGGTVRLSDHRGKWVVVNFWASWCGPCRQETPELQRLADRHPQTLVVMGVNQQESAGVAKEFTDQFGVAYPIALDADGAVSVAYRVTGLPRTLLVDPAGVVRYSGNGRITEDQVSKLEAEYLE